MSSSWIRGPRCGVDNCRTHYYKTIDGQRVCQFGHVAEGHLEYDDEEEVGTGVSTKRIRLPRASQAAVSSQLHAKGKQKMLTGRASRELFFKIHQHLMKLQTKKIMELCDLPPIFENIVKSFYAKYLLKFNSENISDIGNRDYTFKAIPNMRECLGILYIACRYLQLPIYANDIFQWVITNEIPYLAASLEIPDAVREKLAWVMYAKFDQQVPYQSEIYVSAAQIATYLGFQGNKQITVQYEPLLLKIVNDLVLPPRIYHAVKAFIELKEMTFSVPYRMSGGIDSNKNNATLESTELKLMCVIQMVTQLYFINYLKVPDLPRYKIWLSIVESMKTKVNERKAFNYTLTNIALSDEPFMEVLEWEDDKIQKYLDWYEKTMTTKYGYMQTAMRDRLLKIFPMDLYDDEMDKHELEELAEQEKAHDIHTHESAFKQLLQNKHTSASTVITIEGLTEVQKTMVEYFAENFGIEASRVAKAFSNFEHDVLRQENLDKMTQNAKNV